MRYTTLQWSRLFRYCLLFVFISVFITALFMLTVANDWRNMFNLKIQIEALGLAFIFAIYIAIPVLLVRFFYYFYQLISNGRKPGISLFCYQTLFNPINFLFRPSLLTQDGLTNRRRCVVAIILTACLYGSIFAMSQTMT